MRVVGRAVKKVIAATCLNCGSRLEVEGTDDVEWYIEGKFGKTTCPVCGCEHVPVLNEFRSRIVYEHDDDIR